MISPSAVTSTAAFWARAQALCDERRDPCGAPELEAWLDRHPEDARSLYELVARLEALGQAEASRPRARVAPRSARAPRWRVAAGLAAAIVIAVASDLGGRADRREVPEPGAATALTTPASELVSFSVTCVRETRDPERPERRTVRVDEDGIERSEELLRRDASASAVDTTITFARRCANAIPARAFRAPEPFTGHR